MFKRRDIIKGLALLGASLPAKAMAVPSCRVFKKVVGWSITSIDSGFELSSRIATQIPASSVKLKGKTAKFKILPSLGSPKLKFTFQLPANFLIRGTEYGFVDVGDARRKNIFLRRGNKLVRPNMSMSLWVDRRLVFTRPLNWQDGIKVGRVGNLILEPTVRGKSEYDLVVRALRAGSKATIGLYDRDGQLLGRQKYIMGVTTRLNGIQSAWRTGHAEAAKLKEMRRQKLCENKCFLTTACCETFGRPDDCWELETLRGFRDSVLAAMPGGTEDMADYYRLAPRIVDALPQRRWRRALTLLPVYFGTILPCALLIKLRAFGCARHLYSRAFLRYLDRYGVGDSAQGTSNTMQIP